MERLKFIDLFPNIKPEIAKYKAHFAINAYENPPLDAFVRNEFKTWQEYQSKQNFERNYIVSFINISNNDWLFAGIYKSISSQWLGDHYQYETELLNVREDLVGRLIINFEKTFRQTYLNLERYIDSLYVSEILKDRHALKTFPGFENIKLDFSYLKSIILSEEKSWKTALQVVKGIYLIVDKSNGKKYVGSAYGTDAFWTRWSQYCFSGHGGNLELKKIIDEKGIEHANNFQFSILEIRSSSTFDNEIISREKYWKEILLSKEFGYNKN